MSSVSGKSYPTMKGKANLGPASSALCIHRCQGLMNAARLLASLDLAWIEDLPLAIILCRKNRIYGGLLKGQERPSWRAELKSTVAPKFWPEWWKRSLAGWVWVLLAAHGVHVYTQMPRFLHSKAISVGKSCLNCTRKYLANHMLTYLSC